MDFAARLSALTWSICTTCPSPKRKLQGGTSGDGSNESTAQMVD